MRKATPPATSTRASIPTYLMRKPENVFVFESRTILPGILVTYTNDITEVDKYQIVWDPCRNQIISMSNKPDSTLRAETRFLRKNWEGIEPTVPFAQNVDDRRYLCFGIDPKTRIPKIRKVASIDNLMRYRVCVHLLGSPNSQCQMDRWQPAFGLDDYTDRDERFEHDVDIVVEIQPFTRIRFSSTRGMAGFEYSGRFYLKRDLTNIKNYATTDSLVLPACEEAAFTYYDFFTAVLKKIKQQAEAKAKRAVRHSAKKTTSDN